MGILMRVAFVVDLGSDREKALAAPSPAPGQDGTTSFRLHAGTKPVLAFAGALRRLVRSFHRSGGSRVAGSAESSSGPFPCQTVLAARSKRRGSKRMGLKPEESHLEPRFIPVFVYPA
jgi:hypothetical protein